MHKIKSFILFIWIFLMKTWLPATENAHLMSNSYASGYILYTDDMPRYPHIDLFGYDMNNTKPFYKTPSMSVEEAANFANDHKEVTFFVFVKTNELSMWGKNYSTVLFYTGRPEFIQHHLYGNPDIYKNPFVNTYVKTNNVEDIISLENPELYVSPPSPTYSYTGYP